MSDQNVVELIDAVLSQPIGENARSELRSFRSQAEAGTLHAEDRNYVVALCKRLLREPRKSYQPPELNDTRKREEADARKKRIKCQREVGLFLESTRDLRWLYFDLVLRSARNKGEDEKQGVAYLAAFAETFHGSLLSDTEEMLEAFIREPVWESLWPEQDQETVDGLTKQASLYVDSPLFHCTSLRDFFIVRLIESLLSYVHDPVSDGLLKAIRTCMIIFLFLVALALYAFVAWWAAALVLLVLAFRAWRWLKEADNMHKCKVRNRYTRDEIGEIIAAVKRGGYDEPTIVRRLEKLDVKIPPMPKLVTIYGTSYLLGSDRTGVQEHTIPVPDVLYALLRLPRRNVESELSKSFGAPGNQRRHELERRWRKFVDPFLKYDEPDPTRGVPAS